MSRQWVSNIVAVLSLSATWPVFAVTVENLNHSSMTPSMMAEAESTQTVSESIDKNQTKHIRIRQLYAGYPIFGSDGVIHISKQSRVTMNGIHYHALKADLSATRLLAHQEENKQKAVNQAISLAEHDYALAVKPTLMKQQIIIYVDPTKKAHWGYLIKLKAPTARPVYILDAETLAIYKSWNNMHAMEEVRAGGFGGNKNLGRLAYDGLSGNLAELTEDRDENAKICYLRNQGAIIRDGRNDQVMQYPCWNVNMFHNGVYWNANQDEVNGDYSPGNNALYAATILKALYQNWFGLPLLTTEDGKAMPLQLVAHYGDNWENAVWMEDEQVIYLGDGAEIFYPLVSLGIVAHEAAHGFTEQHAGLIYEGQSGGLNESFSDMAAKAAEYYQSGSNKNWQIGGEVMKAKGMALRYLDQPSKDCQHSGWAGQCSIDEMKDYRDDLDVHFSSGIFNRAFYLISTSPNWNTKKAFEIMVQANRFYWTPTSNFTQAACGVLKATNDYQYDVDTVNKAFSIVGINTKDC